MLGAVVALPLPHGKTEQPTRVVFGPGGQACWGWYLSVRVAFLPLLCAHTVKHKLVVFFRCICLVRLGLPRPS